MVRAILSIFILALMAACVAAATVAAKDAPGPAVIDVLLYCFNSYTLWRLWKEPE